MKKFCLLLVVLLSYIAGSGQGTGYVTLKGRQFYDQQGNPFFPMVMNYHIDIVHDQAGNPQFKIVRSTAYGTMGCLLEGGYSFIDCENSLAEDFAKLHQIGFNTVRITGGLTPHHNNGSLGFHTLSGLYDFAADPNPNFCNSKITFNLNSPYTNADAQNLFALIAAFMDIAQSNNMKVILLCTDGSDKSYDDRGTDDANALDYAAYLTQLAAHIYDKPALLAYDLYNEPHWNVYDHNLTQSKQKVCEYVGWWYDAIKASDQNHLITIGGTDVGDVLDWDGNIMKVDFISMHLYPVFPDYENHDLTKAVTRVLDFIYWCSNALQRPWIIGETGLSASPDACINSYPGATDGDYTDQYNYMASVLPAMRDCGGSGFSWWEFMDVHWYCIPAAVCSSCTYCNICGSSPSTPDEIHGNYWGLLQYSDPVNGSYPSSADKDATAFTTAFNEGNGTPAPAPCTAPSANYPDPYNCGIFNPTHHNAVTGTIVDNDGNPIKGGVVQALSWRYTTDPNGFPYDGDEINYHTWFYYYADDNGNFEVIPYNDVNTGQDRIIYVRGSAPGAEKFERGEAYGTVNPDGWSDVQMQPAALGNITLKNVNFQYNGVFDGENVPASTTKNLKGWNSVTVSNTTIDGIGDITAREEIHINSEFHASAGSEVHIFPSDAFMDCDATSTFLRMAQNHADNEAQAAITKQIEIDFKKDLKPDVSIIPNPNSGLCAIEILNSENANAVISIKSLFGYELKRLTTTEKNISLDLHNFSKGIYFVEAVFENNKITKKLIIQ
jgi:hypothetical protein